MKKDKKCIICGIEINHILPTCSAACSKIYFDKEKGRVPRMKNPPLPPKAPLSRVKKDFVGYYCINCGSTCSKNGFLGLFGTRLCDNDECPNSKQIFK